MDRVVKVMLASLCLFFAVPIFSQTYNVVGLVQDEEKGEPLGQVEISLKSGKVLGYSKSNGRFEITVNSHNATLVFKRHTYKATDLDLSDLPELIDLDVTMQSDVLELSDVDTTAPPQSRQFTTAKTMEELELMQGMRIDLNDHLRQLPGVSGMNEFTNDISVWGSRTNDVTHYLGQSRIPSLRHLDIGFPGNQSVLNPRLLKSITVSDNLAKGPLNQGNASALVYELKDGDPNNITGDLVFGTVNRELNMTGYWGGRTFLISGRYLEPTFLANLGQKFFTEAKDARVQSQDRTCEATKDCVARKSLENAFKFRTMDGYLGTFFRDSTGAFARHSFMGLDDTYQVDQDISTNFSSSKAQTIVKGTQDGFMYAYEALAPYASGDLTYAYSILQRNREEAFRDTLIPFEKVTDIYPWYLRSGSKTVDPLIGDGATQDLQVNGSFQWNPTAKFLGASYSYGLDLEFLREIRKFKNVGGDLKNLRVPEDYTLATYLYRLKWDLANAQTLEAAIGSAFVYQAAFVGENSGFLAPAPILSLRYARPLPGKLTAYGETAIRQNTALAPSGFNRIQAFSTSSAEGKLGVEGGFGREITFTSSLYSRFYKDPRLPAPEVFWNNAESHRSDFAYANGGNLTATWLPSHHIGMNVNASIVQGDYHLEDDSYLPWESNRTLDLVSNIRIVPRKDSLLSFIFTYGVNNGAPLYEYTGLYDADKSISRNQRTIRPSRDYPTVSRQRTDLRINLDLKSKWRPLEGMRFFFEADNMFADATGPAMGWLGGNNERKRGWTRANSEGDLRPVITRGMGLFIMFGFEGRLLL